jgi:hypothetical protein
VLRLSDAEPYPVEPSARLVALQRAIEAEVERTETGAAADGGGW